MALKQTSSPLQQRKGPLSPHPHQHLCHLFSWWQPFWLDWDGFSVHFCYAFSQWLRMLKTFSNIYWTFLLLKSNFSVYLFIYWCDIFKYLDFFVDSRSITTHQMYNFKTSLLFQRLSLHCQYLFSLLCRRLWVSCNSVCWLLELSPKVLEVFLRYVYILKCFPPGVFRVASLSLRPLIYFELIWVESKRY